MPRVAGEFYTDDELIERAAQLHARGATKAAAWQEVFDPDHELDKKSVAHRASQFWNQVPWRKKRLQERVRWLKEHGITGKPLPPEQEADILVGQLNEVVSRAMQAVPVLDRQGNQVSEPYEETCPKCHAKMKVRADVWQHDGPVAVRAIHEIGLLRSLIVRRSESTKKGELDGKSRSEVLRRIKALEKELGVGRGTPGVAGGAERATH